jgi:hypothetical protein
VAAIGRASNAAARGLRPAKRGASGYAARGGYAASADYAGHAASADYAASAGSISWTSRLFGSAPMIWCATWPCLKSSSVGIDITP